MRLALYLTVSILIVLCAAACVQIVNGDPHGRPKELS